MAARVEAADEAAPGGREALVHAAGDPVAAVEQQVADALEQRRVAFACPACASEEIVLVDGYFSQPIMRLQDDGSRFEPERYHVLLAIECTSAATSGTTTSPASASRPKGPNGAGRLFGRISPNKLRRAAAPIGGITPTPTGTKLAPIATARHDVTDDDVFSPCPSRVMR